MRLPMTASRCPRREALCERIRWLHVDPEWPRLRLGCAKPARAVRRHVHQPLARDFTIVAVDQRGIGLSDKPEKSYDTATLANDLVWLMDALGHQRGDPGEGSFA
jgi:pimeloyl-ACP methyl ester carboxylesterase